MSDSDFWALTVLYFIIFIIFVPYAFQIGREPMELYQPKNKRKRMEQKPRMKYVTRLSHEETLSRLLRMNTPLDSTFKKEGDDEKDRMYVFEITEVPVGYRGMFRGSVRYRVMVTPAQEGSAVWVFLLALDRRWLHDADLVPINRLGDDEMLNMFAWEVEKLFGKLLDAVRVE